MATSFSSILRSKQFTFLVGEDEEPIVVHSGVIAKLSAPLGRLVNGPMKEAEERVAHIPDLEVGDFERLCEYAYSGGYTEPEMSTYADEDLDIRDDIYILSDSIASKGADGHHTWPFAQFWDKSYGNFAPVMSQPKTSPVNRSTTLNCVMSGKSTISNGSDDDNGEDNGSIGRQTWKSNVGNVLLGHARLYVFAKKYMIEILQHLTLHKLHKFLMDLRIYPATRGSILDLVEYVYDTEHISDAGETEPVDRMRALVIKFIALHGHAFVDFPEHRSSLREESEYAVDYMDFKESMLLHLEIDMD